MASGKRSLHKDLRNALWFAHALNAWRMPEHAHTCRMDTSMAESTAKMVRFSATGFEKSESKRRNAESSSSASEASMTQCSGGSSALASAPRRELACASSSTDAIILAMGLPSSFSVSSALKRPIMAPLTRKGESMPRAWISSSMYRLRARARERCVAAVVLPSPGHTQPWY